MTEKSTADYFVIVSLMWAPGPLNKQSLEITQTVPLSIRLVIKINLIQTRDCSWIIV